MRTKYVVIAVLFAGSAHANIIPLSDFRSVSVSGVAGIVGGGDSYSQEQTPSGPFNKFNGNVAGSADWSDPAPTSWYGLMGSYHADSSANQSSTIAADQISVDANLRGSTWVSLAGPYGPASSSASSIFEVSFGVLTPLEYQLDASRSAWFHDLPPPSFDFHLSSASAGTILGNGDLFASSHFSGVLLPDVYTLRFNADLSTVPDPLGDSKFASYRLNLRVTSVPDKGTTAMLLLISLVALIGGHQAVARQTREATEVKY